LRQIRESLAIQYTRLHLIYGSHTESASLHIYRIYTSPDAKLTLATTGYVPGLKLPGAQMLYFHDYS